MATLGRTVGAIAAMAALGVVGERRGGGTADNFDLGHGEGAHR